MEIQKIMHLERERQKINVLDKKLLALLDKRLEIARKIVRIKQKNNLQIFQPGREKEIFENICRLSKHSKFTIEIFKKIIEQSKKFQEERIK